MKMKKILIPLITLVFLLGLSSTALAKVIKVGGLKDTTGATSDVGKDAAIGQAEFWSHYVNDHGGINGKKVMSGKIVKGSLINYCKSLPNMKLLR